MLFIYGWKSDTFFYWYPRDQMREGKKWKSPNYGVRASFRKLDFVCLWGEKKNIPLRFLIYSTLMGLHNQKIFPLNWEIRFFSISSTPSSRFKSISFRENGSHINYLFCTKVCTSQRQPQKESFFFSLMWIPALLSTN